MAPKPFLRQVFRTFGLTEAQVREAVKDLLEPSAGVRLELTTGATGVDIHVMYHPASTEKGADGLIRRFQESLRKRLHKAIYSEEGKEMEEVVAQVLKERGLRLAVAESCTGGLISHRLTNIPGSSAYFERGLICYSDLSKTELLGVPPEWIARYGTVSPQVAVVMAEGIQRLAKTDLGLGVTGIAGPGGATSAKPIGLVCIALAYQGETQTESHQLVGDRASLKLSFSQAALDLVRRSLMV